MSWQKMKTGENLDLLDDFCIFYRPETLKT